MNEDQQVSPEEFAHENEHVEEPWYFYGVWRAGYVLFAVIGLYVLWLLFFRAIPFLINS